ncbi:flavodoxin [Candidatus Thorarchaeota archaeon]|nr:MAG: flavodoxin [Candidatus Thorarchaeota archaeon]
MKTAIVCKSIHHGNTLQVAEAMAEELGADIFTPEEIDDETLRQYDMIGFGSGIYNARHHRSLLNRVKDLHDLSTKEVFVFYTSGFDKFPVFSSFETALSKELEEKGVHIAGMFHCRGFQTWGPFRFRGGRNKGHPDEADLENARAFVRNLDTAES